MITQVVQGSTPVRLLAAIQPGNILMNVSAQGVIWIGDDASMRPGLGIPLQPGSSTSVAKGSQLWVCMDPSTATQAILVVNDQTDVVQNSVSPQPVGSATVFTTTNITPSSALQSFDVSSYNNLRFTAVWDGKSIAPNADGYVIVTFYNSSGVVTSQTKIELLCAQSNDTGLLSERSFALIVPVLGSTMTLQFGGGYSHLVSFTVFGFTSTVLSSYPYYGSPGAMLISSAITGYQLLGFLMGQGEQRMFQLSFTASTAGTVPNFVFFVDNGTSGAIGRTTPPFNVLATNDVGPVYASQTHFNISKSFIMPIGQCALGLYNYDSPSKMTGQIWLTYVNAAG